MIRSDLFLAHVRASTTGETSRVNCHPFTHARWAFMHNGQVPDIIRIRRRLEAILPDDLYDARRGSTDSELIFLLLLAHGLRNDPLRAVRRTIALIQTHSLCGQGRDAVRLTCVFSEGQRLYAFRHTSDGRAPTLYAARRPDQSWTFASEPLDHEARDWAAIPAETLVSVQRGASALHAAPLQALLPV